MAVSYPFIYIKIKRLLSNITNIPIKDIYADTKLRPNPLGFTPQGLRALAPKLNDVFDNEGLNLQRSDMPNLKSVRSIAHLIHSKIS